MSSGDLGVTAPELTHVPEPFPISPSDDDARKPGSGDETGRAAHPSPWRRAGRRFTTEPVAMAAVVVVILVALMAVFAPLITKYDPNYLDTQPCAGPSKDHWLGTDNLGRDTFSRMVDGARVSLEVSV